MGDSYREEFRKRLRNRVRPVSGEKRYRVSAEALAQQAAIQWHKKKEKARQMKLWS